MSLEPTDSKQEKIPNEQFGGAHARDEFRGRRLLRQVLIIAILVPVIFWLRFGELDTFGIGFTLALVALVLFVAFALWAREQKQLHTSVELRPQSRAWLDRIGGFWLMACVFGPMLGWLATRLPALDTSNFRFWLSVRVALAAGVPILTALPLVRYVDAASSKVTVPLLAIVTGLATFTGVAAAHDLLVGPQSMKDEAGRPILVLKYLDRVLE